jgi:glutaredoxin
MDVLIFTLSDCEHCNDLKKRLNGIKIPFKELEINKHKAFWNDIVKETGSDVVPTVCLMDNVNKGARILIPGRDFHTEDDIIYIIKKYTL